MAASRRRWFQFSLRGLLILLTALAIGLGWLGRRVERAREQREAVAALSGKVQLPYDFQLVAGPWKAPDRKPPAPDWLVQTLGAAFFEDVVRVGVRAYFADANGEPRAEYDHLPWNVNPADLEHLRKLPRLRMLDLHGVALTDADLKYIMPLGELRELDLRETKVTDSGIAALHEALPECVILH